MKYRIYYTHKEQLCYGYCGYPCEDYEVDNEEEAIKQFTELHKKFDEEWNDAHNLNDNSPSCTIQEIKMSGEKIGYIKGIFFNKIFKNSHRCKR